MNKSNYTEILPNGFTFDMIKVEGGSFMMGSEKGRDGEKRTVPDFYIGTYPVTQGLWQAIMGENPSHFKGTNRPVESVSWDDVQVFIQKLNEKTGKTYRLPSETEWEYAARGGKNALARQEKGTDFTYAGSNKLKEVGWYGDNSHSETKPVGMKFPNELGLYDMSGNVYEWCADVRNNDSDTRVVRGGSWDYDGSLLSRLLPPRVRYR